MEIKLIVTVSDKRYPISKLQKFGELKPLSSFFPTYSLITDNRFVDQIKSIEGIMVEENKTGQLKPVIA